MSIDDIFSLLQVNLTMKQLFEWKVKSLSLLIISVKTEETDQQQIVNATHMLHAPGEV